MMSGDCYSLVGEMKFGRWERYGMKESRDRSGIEAGRDWNWTDLLSYKAGIKNHDRSFAKNTPQLIGPFHVILEKLD